MSDKHSKGYDPTVLRAIGNILAGSEEYQGYLTEEMEALRRAFIQGVTGDVLYLRDYLKKEDPQ